MTMKKKYLGCIRKADEEFNLIQDGDKVSYVGVSGGKDSMLLFILLIII